MNRRLRSSLLSLLLTLTMVLGLALTAPVYGSELQSDADVILQEVTVDEMTEDAEVLAASGVGISQTSLTIQTEQEAQLYVTVDGVRTDANAWGSSDSEVAKVDNTGKVTGVAAGSCVITAMVNGETVECVVSVVRRTTTGTVRYNALIVDASDSVEGIPLEREKEAAKRFCKTVLESSGTNYIAVISLSGTSEVVCGLTDNYNTLVKAIDGMECSFGTNMNAAMKDAKSILDSVPDGDNVMKNAILCSDGLPQKGTKTESGRYTSEDHSKYYAYANAVYNTAKKMKDNNNFVYALGFFHNSTGKNLTFGKKLMKDLASKDKYYVVTDPEDIDEAMKEIADQITNLVLSEKSKTIYVNENYQLTAYMNGQETAAQWSSSDSTIAVVDQYGRVTGISEGSCIITAEVDGKKVTCKFTVYAEPTITLSKSSLTVYKDCSKTLTASVTGLSNKVTWSSSDKAIAKVSSKGVVTGVKKGSCTITAKCNGVKASCKVTVKNPDIKLNKTELYLYTKETAKLKATVHGKSSKVKWTSTKKSVATVNSTGKITAKKEGSCYIKATCNGVTAKCKVTVEKKHPPYSFWVTCNTAVTRVGSKKINEQGCMLKYNEDGKITKAAAYIYKSGSYYYFIVACKGDNLTSVECDCYLGKDGKMIYDYYNTKSNSYHMNHFYFSKDSYGVYSYSGNYGAIRFNVTDKNGTYLTIKKAKANGKYFKVFDDLTKMKEYLQK